MDTDAAITIVFFYFFWWVFLFLGCGVEIGDKIVVVRICYQHLNFLGWIYMGGLRELSDSQSEGR